MKLNNENYPELECCKCGATTQKITKLLKDMFGDLSLSILKYYGQTEFVVIHKDPYKGVLHITCVACERLIKCCPVTKCIFHHPIQRRSYIPDAF